MPPRVLLVEDDEDIRAVVREALTELGGYEVGEAADGAAGLQAAAGAAYDLVLLDLTLPDLDGREVLRRLRAQPQTASVPVVAVTGKETGDGGAGVLAQGFAARFTKPFDLDDLLARVRGLLAGAR